MKEAILPLGYRGGVASAAIKKPGRLDMCLILSDSPASAAGVFTKNLVKGAPVLLNMERLKNGIARAILANSGNANACTGDQGLRDAEVLSEALGKALSISEDEILLASTGVIGQRLPLDRMIQAIPELVKGLSTERLPKVAEAILTTDKFPKIAFHKGSIGGRDYTIYGIAKGAGMIMPHMATMLCFVLTDLGLSSKELQWALLEAVDKSFNRITVDGDTSTNDMVLALANGLVGNGMLNSHELSSFQDGLTSLLKSLSEMIVKDGEGATKLVRVKVVGASKESEAEAASRTIANSLLVKTAIFGGDPNWGRIMAALGRSGCTFDPHKVDIYMGGVKIVENGLGLGQEAEEKAKAQMKGDELELVVDLKSGNSDLEILTCDLTYEYVKINAEYRT